MVKFFGCPYDESRVHPDPEKVDAVYALPTPTNITELQQFLGMVTYLSPFIPGLSIQTAPLHELLKKDTEVSWDASYQTAFQSVKDAVVSGTTLSYFDASCPITVQVDASQVRLGAALLQENKSVPFTSKALTEVEHQYAKSDHKPLETITKKSLADIPAQLQCMLICLPGYDYVLHYHPGKEMALPDTLSCFKPQTWP